MKNVIKSIFLLLLVINIACDENEDFSDEGMSGTWLLYEQGYSPGAGYITDKVLPFPSHTITLKSDYTFSSNFIDDYHFYRLIDDPDHAGSKILALYKEDPGTAPQDPYHLEHSYSVEIKGDKLKLYYRWCIEGCHMALKKIRAEDGFQELCGTPPPQ